MVNCSNIPFSIHLRKNEAPGHFLPFTLKQNDICFIYLHQVFLVCVGVLQYDGCKSDGWSDFPCTLGEGQLVVT